MQSYVTQRGSLRRRLLACAAIGIFAGNSILPALATDANDNNTASPIKHVIVIIGENRSFDHIFATYQPVNSGETVLNLLSEGIVNADGTPGPNYHKAVQYNANDYDAYHLAPMQQPFTTLPTATVGGTKTPYVCEFFGVTSGTSCNDYPNGPNYTNLVQQKIENGLEPEYQQYLLTGGTGQTNKTPDLRVHYDGQTATTLPPGPYQLTNNVDATNPIPTTPTRRARCIASCRCSSSSTATRARPRRVRASAARRASSLGSKRPIGAGANGAAAPVGHLAERRRSKVRPRSASTTCSRATFRTSSISPTPTR